MEKCCISCMYYGGFGKSERERFFYCERYNEYKLFQDPNFYFCDDYSLSSKFQ